MANPSAAELVADPRWLPYRYDIRRDELHFMWLPREEQRKLSFLTEATGLGAQRIAVPFSELAAAQVAPAPLHVILHSGLTGSTLLAKALDQPGRIFTLKEPPILTDLISQRVNKGSRVDNRELVELVARLLARPFEAGEAVVIKVGSVGNAAATDMLAAGIASRALCLHAPLPTFLAALAAKDLWGRLWGRKLFIGLRNGRLADFGYDENQLLEQTDLQIGALAWLAIHRMLYSVASTYGPERARAYSSEQLTDRPGESLAAIGKHFAVDLDVDSILSSDVFTRHSKSGEQYDSSRRARILADARAAHGEEIGKVVGWARAVAEAAGIAWELPHAIQLPPGSRAA